MPAMTTFPFAAGGDDELLSVLWELLPPGAGEREVRVQAALAAYEAALADGLCHEGALECAAQAARAAVSAVNQP